ncbi:MAG: HEAT repeat domain-containing protein [Myxococcota bacterium]
MSDDQTPHVGSVRAGPAVAAVLYALLVGSAVLALWVRNFPGKVPAHLEAAAPWVFLVFIICFALYRWSLMRAKKYPAAKAFFQVGVAVLFFMLLLPQGRPSGEAAGDEVEALLSSTTPQVRALAAEVARYRPDGRKYGKALVKALEDREPRVRQEAHRSLVALAGEDVGGPDDEGAIEKWSEKFR